MIETVTVDFVHHARFKLTAPRPDFQDADQRLEPLHPD
jgi:hypothetical protein